MNNPDMTGLGSSTVPCSWAPQMLMPPVDWNSSSRKGKKKANRAPPQQPEFFFYFDFLINI
jgi:hypothetical protein